MNIKTTDLVTIGVVLILGLFILYLTGFFNSSANDEFAQCLTDEGAKFYGTFWCSHCSDQKAIFGDSIQYVNYIECSTPDKMQQTQICIDAGIDSYPTWDFEGGLRSKGVLTLEELSDKTGCSLTPEN